MAEATLRTPPSLDLASENLEMTWKTWKRQVEFYLIASGADQKDQGRDGNHADAGPHARQVCHDIHVPPSVVRGALYCGSRGVALCPMP